MRTLKISAIVMMTAAACCFLAAESGTSSESDAPYLIPNLKAWEQVQEGMTVEELEHLLGKPLTKTGPKGDWKPNSVHEWTYGYVARKSAVQPEDLAFSVQMEMGKVWSKEDPFGKAPISMDGMPSVPVLMTPNKDTLFTHYPRIVDFRWYPASGDYPMKYELDIGFRSPTRGWVQNPVQAVDSTYYCYSHSGMNQGRWRVRAINSSGKSQWSEYSYFEFNR